MSMFVIILLAVAVYLFLAWADHGKERYDRMTPDERREYYRKLLNKSK